MGNGMKSAGCWAAARAAAIRQAVPPTELSSRLEVSVAHDLSDVDAFPPPAFRLCRAGSLGGIVLADSVSRHSRAFDKTKCAPLFVSSDEA